MSDYVGKLTPDATLEVMELRDRARQLSKIGTAACIAEAAALRDQARTIVDVTHCSSRESMEKYTYAVSTQAQNAARPSEEKRMKAFHRYMLAGEDGLTAEMRNDLTAGQQTVTWTAGPQGGYTVPITTESQIRAAMAAIDPLLSESVTDFQLSDNLNPTTISSYDLSTVTAVNTLETGYTAPSSFPNATANTLTPYVYRAGPYGASIEALQDVPDAVDRLYTLFGVALGRGISQAVTVGNGVTDVDGILSQITTRVYATGAGKIVANDLTNIWFSLNSYWRRQPKVAWVCSDSVVQRLRQVQDSSGRNLLRLNDGDSQVRLFGAPIYTSPSLPTVGGSLGLNSELLLGDWSQFRIRMSKPIITRSINSATKDITLGQALFSCRAKVSAVYQDASSGVSPSIIAATVTA